MRDEQNQELVNSNSFIYNFGNAINNQERIIRDNMKIQETINSPNKKCQFQVLQEVSNSTTYQHNIYCQVANKSLKNYHSKMENQMHTKYKIHKYPFKVSDLVKIQIAKIDHGPSDCCALLCKIFLLLPNNMYHLTCHFGVLKNVFLASKVLPLRLKEFSELDTLASNKECNCRGDCLIARCFCKKANILYESGCYPKNSKCKHKA
ncbi:retrotransposon nucleocapsid protein [Gigaspora margarita]|uniref:Retrotransposon nucleocapsid protein n=1 Tax=Gigaspora margarita TaxID=4874 RepID=A0A8H3ZYH6_GIGMA|nr:retrotransposon nucleocapsid protein [Gigaspora margarita]